MRLLVVPVGVLLLGECVANILTGHGNVWYGSWDGPLAPTIIPLTPGWKEHTSTSDWLKGRPADSQAGWNSSDNPLRLFQDAQLSTTRGDQAVSFLFIGSDLTIMGSYDGIITPRLLIDGVSYDGSSSAPNVTWHLDGPGIPSMLGNPQDSGRFLVVVGLGHAWHNMTIITPAAFDGNLSITRGVFSQLGNVTQGATIPPEVIQGDVNNLLSFAHEAIDSRLETTGDVSVHNYKFNSYTPDFQLARKMSVACLRGDAALSMRLPVNSSFVTVQGFLAPNYGVLTTTIDPPPPFGGEMWSFSTNRTVLLQDDFFIQVPLDPAVHYKMKLATESATSGEGVYLKSAMIIPYDNSTRDYWVKDDPVAEPQTSTDSQASADGQGKGSHTNSSSLRPGAIAGITVGCVLVLFLFGALWFVLRKKFVVRRVDKVASWREGDEAFEIEEEPSSISPFLASAVPLSGLSAKQLDSVSSGSPSTLSSLPPQHGEGHMRSMPAKHSIMADILAGRYTSDGRQERETGSRPVEIVQEDDAGSVDGGNEDIVERQLVPPRYDPAWEHRLSRGDTEDSVR